ncbi:hypothetical protein TELCIR_09251 [Teladorsagia circumcincta]|uniref:DNA2/NAM7 helicase-like C-terminal domain-containing protein n=1 Tax=Teladorsagia circumcincta TaxID=45464 RepID=A0A2G9UFI8_TELCI|nr:hypothetical protein TELCIR_09251 [Teladorsagia circumcincta]
MQFPTPDVPFFLLGVEGPSVKEARKSHHNVAEGAACVSLIERLLAKQCSRRECVTSFHMEQSRHLKARLRELRMELTTVDYVQGIEKEREREANTRADFSAYSADFLDKKG